ncbi:MAG: adenylyl-sulfate kinase [Nitrososphaerales archaeon]|nr:adenylyl-sulfate kinase [Nitrososphaerales archaeon]
MAFSIWLTGLPGSGKSTIARELLKIFKERNIDVRYLQLDEIRNLITPNPTYDEREREIVYRAYVVIAKFLYDEGLNILLDATAHRRRWREFARSIMPRFIEVYIKCPIEVCIQRETERLQDFVRKKIYLNALERLKSGKEKAGLGEVPGVDVPYEEPLNPEIVIESDKIQPSEAASIILDKLIAMGLLS